MKALSFLLEAVFIAALGTVFLISTLLLLAFILLYLLLALVAAICLSPFALLYVWTVGWPKKKEEPRKRGGLLI